MTYYMGGTGGGVWKTTNAGISWKNISDKYFRTGSVGAVAVSRSDPNVIYVGMGEAPFRGVASGHGDGVYKSTDAGKTWVNIGLKGARQISGVRIHPTNPDIVYVGVQGSPWAATKERGVYRSLDGGKSWKKVLFVNDVTGVSDIKMDATNPRILYAAMWDSQRKPWEIRSGGPGSGLYKSTDGGDKWEEMTEGLPDLKGKMGIAPSPANPQRIWAIIEASKKGGLYRSDDGGKKWKHVNGDRRLHARSWYYMDVFADPKDENTVYVLNSGIFRSVDGGKSVENIRVPHGDTHDLWINPDNSRNLINANDGGATISFDGGKSWSSLNNQPTAQFYRVNVDNRLAYRVYGGQQDNSTVAIASWAPDGSIGREDYHSVGGCESAFVGFDPDNTRFVYAGCYLGQITEYDEQRQRIRRIRAYPETAFGVPPKERKYRFNWNAPIVVSKHDPKVIYHGANVLLKSTDRGHSWVAVSPDLTRNDPATQGPGGRPITNEVSENYNTLSYVAESPFDAGVIWTGSDDGLVHLTRDGGQTWADVTPRGVGPSLVNSIELSPFDKGTAYAVMTRYKYNDLTPFVFKTSNYGKNWRRISGDLPKDDFIRVLREDPAKKGLLYAGSETSSYVSFDGGKKWQNLQLNLPHVPVTDMIVHGRDLVVSTQGRAFWILDDISPLRQMTADVGKEKLHLFAPSKAIDMRTGGFGRGGAVADNPPAGAIIYYTLARAPDLKKETVELQILDSTGTVIRTLKSDRKKGAKGGGNGSGYALPAKEGLNRAVWDLRTKPAAKIKGVFAIAGRRGGSISGYRVLPGTYTLKLKAGDTTAEQSLEVTYDPRIMATADEEVALRKFVASVFERIDELHRTVSGMRSVKSQVDEQVKLAKKRGGDAALEKAGKDLSKKIETWEGAQISDKREFFQDVLNWPDRLDSDLQSLMGTADSTDAPVTAGMEERFSDLDGEFRKAMAARDKLLAEVSAFNALARDNKTPAITVPKMTAEADDEETKTEE